jgi:hypothetical protein
MFIMTTVLYPQDKAVKVSETFIKATKKPLPSFVKRLYVLTRATTLGGKVHGIYEVDDAKVKEGMMELTKYFAQFSDIVGFTYEMEPMLTAQEAMPLVGVKMP